MPVTSKVTYTKELLMDFYWFSLKRKVVFWSFFAFYNLFVIGCTLFMLNVGAELDSTFKLCLIIMSFLDVLVFLSYIVLPQKGAEIRVAADVAEFEMSELAINATKMNLDSGV